MGNQSSSSPSPRPIYTVHSVPWNDNTTSTSTEPADSNECHACAARQDSTATTPTDAPVPSTPHLTTTTTQPLDSIRSTQSLPAASSSTTTTTALHTPLTATNAKPTPCYAYSHSACPLNRAELGRAAWAYLHTLAAYYPVQATPAQQHDMRTLLTLYMQQYPCLYCRDRTMEEVDRNAPRVGGRGELSVWMCEVHNEVNERLGKPVFDCGGVEQRWRTGPTDGSCGGG